MSELDKPLPVHPFTGLTAIGLRRNGDPVWPVIGGAEDDQDGDDDADTDRADDADDAGEDDKPLGPKGEKALEAEKSKRRAAAEKARAAEAENAKLKAELDKLRKGETADTPDPEQIKAEARKEAQAEVLRERALDKVEAKAAKLFADPEDARALLAEKAGEFIDGTKIDLDAINEALEDLLKRKPHLAAQGGKRFEGSADQGSRKGGSRPAQLTKADLDRMSPEQIVEAKKKGQFDDLLGIKR